MATVFFFNYCLYKYFNPRVYLIYRSWANRFGLNVTAVLRADARSSIVCGQIVSISTWSFSVLTRAYVSIVCGGMVSVWTSFSHSWVAVSIDCFAGSPVYPFGDFCARFVHVGVVVIWFLDVVGGGVKSICMIISCPSCLLTCRQDVDRRVFWTFFTLSIFHPFIVSPHQILFEFLQGNRAGTVVLLYTGCTAVRRQADCWLHAGLFGGAFFFRLTYFLELSQTNVRIVHTTAYSST